MRAHIIPFVMLFACSRSPNGMTPASPPGVVTGMPASQALPAVRATGALEQVATLSGAMPTGITISRSGRIFINYPLWGDSVAFTVAELRNGLPAPFPDLDTSGTASQRDVSQRFVSVQSVVVDPRDRLWVLDTGSVMFGPVTPGGAKLVAIDLATNRIIQTIAFSENIALPTSYLNDVRFDLRRGSAGVAYITDSSDKGSNAIVVVDLASGTARRRLVDHPSVKAEPGFMALVEGRPLLLHDPASGQLMMPQQSLAMGADGIAISPDGATLYYCPLASRRLYAVPTDALLDERLSDAELGRRVLDLGDKGASDGLESDAQGRVYVTLYEQQAIARRSPDGTFETIISDPRLLWPDTLSVGADGYLYVTANQLHRQARFEGRDMREQPYSLFRVRIDGARIDESSQTVRR
jgi:sugar lactone lactonase YvrE